jgi:hypothetical protein
VTVFRREGKEICRISFNKDEIGLIFDFCWRSLRSDDKSMVKINMQYNSVIVTLATVNFDHIVSFYTQFLEQEPEKLIPHVYAEFQLASLKLGIFKPKQANEAEFMTNTPSQLSLCLEVNNLETAISHLTSLGYPPPGEISIASHGQEIYTYDPDGNRLILHQSNNN